MMPEKYVIPPKTENDRFTDDQWRAIHQSGNNLLVAASAGSGKTTVLVQRIIEKVKNGTNVDELLVVTFTESAAAEMKERLRVAIQEAVNEAVSQEQYRHLVRQITLLPQANISTIHAFCLKVIQRFFYLIDIDPVFRMMGDAIEIEMLMEDVWEDVKDELYGEGDSAFRQLAKAYSNDRNDEGLKDLIFSLYNFSRANPEPNKWLDKLTNIYDINQGLEKSFLFQELLKPQILEELNGILYHNTNAVHLGGEYEGIEKQRAFLLNEQEMIAEIRTAIQEDDYQGAFERISNLTFGTWPRKKKDDPDADLKDQMKGIRDQYRKTIKSLQESFFTRSKEEHEEIIQSTTPFIEEMIRVTKRFAAAYWQRKVSGNMLDFNDLEHLTLQILLHVENETWLPSEASLYYREKFEEVLIDEYQDVNKLQETILFGVTRHNPDIPNLFMVGDVKQSIYAFRLADPGLFLEKYEKFGQSIDGERIILAENFRSRGEVISFTNFIFTQLMDKKVGQMDYDELAELKQGNMNFPVSENLQTELLIYLKENIQDDAIESEMSEQADFNMDWGIDDKATGEITIVAQKIRDLVQNKTEIYDKKKKANRPISYKDIVLLTPTKKNNLLILETFKEYGIPVILNDSQSFFQRTEITIILSLLKVIDNPRQDIPLAAVLRSPIVGLNERQLAKLRISLPYGDFYDAVLAYMENYQEGTFQDDHESEDAYQKLSYFLEQLKGWRQAARQNDLVRLIWKIYEETLFLDYVGGMTAGKQRVANLHALYERAKNYETTNYKGLFQFIRFIERIQQRDQDLAEPTTFSEDEDAVRIMTIHASKGLEFPIVFVMDLSKSFNMKDINGKYLFSEEYGIGSDFFDPDLRMRFPSLTTYALKNVKKKQLLAEEMRKLYVALTRAEQKLLLVGTYASPEKMWQEWSAVDETTNRLIPDHLRLNASNMMKWIGYALYRHHLVDSDSMVKQYRGELTNYPVDFSISFYDEADLLGNIVTVNLEEEQIDLPETVTQLTTFSAKESMGNTENQFKKAVQLMEATYEHQVASQTTSYQSVSEIKRLFEDPDQAQLLQLEFGHQQAVARYVEPELARPSFLQEKSRPTSAEIGTAVHYVIQSLPLDQAINLMTLEDLVKQLVERGSLNENVVSYMDLNQIVSFFATDLGRRLLNKPESVSREVPFTMLMRAGNLFEGIQKDADDKLLIHGIIDGFIEYPDHLVLFDFKTDYVGDRLEELVNKYRGQMIVYREALAQVKQKPVKETYLCFLATKQNILVDE